MWRARAVAVGAVIKPKPHSESAENNHSADFAVSMA